jgi:arylsulfate sulfotransferase
MVSSLLSKSHSGLPAFVDPPQVAPNPNPAVPLAAVVRFQADRPVETRLEVSDGAHRWVLTYDETHHPAEGLAVVGLRPGRRHRLHVSIRDAAGRVAHAAQELAFDVPPVPGGHGEFPPLRVTAGDPAAMEPGITLLNVRRRVAGDMRASAAYGLLLALDAQGEVVWSYRAPARISDLEPLRNGNLLYLTTDFRAVEIDLLGNVVASWYAARRPQGPAAGAAVDTLTFHHEIEELPWGNLVVAGSERRVLDDYWSSETDAAAPRGPARVMGDEIVEFQRDGTVVWRWNAFDHLDPYRIGYDTFFPYWQNRGFPETCDWTHGNGLFYDASDDALIVSLRMQDAVIKVDRASGEIRWIAGEATDWPPALQGRLLRLEKGRWFYHQHAPSLTPQGTLLVFDNGNFLSRPFTPATPLAETYSRAAEYALDPGRGTAREVWASDAPGPESVITYAMGDADWLPRTGNVLVSYGLCVPRVPGLTWENALRYPCWTRAREVTHSDPPQVVWEVVLRDEEHEPPVGWNVFGSKRLSRLGALQF